MHKCTAYDCVFKTENKKSIVTLLLLQSGLKKLCSIITSLFAMNSRKYLDQYLGMGGGGGFFPLWGMPLCFYTYLVNSKLLVYTPHSILQPFRNRAGKMTPPFDPSAKMLGPHIRVHTYIHTSYILYVGGGGGFGRFWISPLIKKKIKLSSYIRKLKGIRWK